LALNLIDLLTDENGQPYLETLNVKLRTSSNDLAGEMVKISEATNCRLTVFVELPAGFKSTSRIPDRDQIAVVLSGTLRISAKEDQVKRLEAGGVFRLPQAENSTHILEAIGPETVRLMVLQA
jgi:quercetin dioxygenase-like cupin family protein